MTERWYGKSNWFSLPRAIRYDDRLSHADVRVLLAIASFEMKGGEIYPPRWQLALYTGIDETNISKRTAALVRCGWLAIIRAKGKVNKYTLHIPEYVIERQKIVGVEVEREVAVRAEKKKRTQQEWCAENRPRERQPAPKEVDERQMDIEYDFEAEMLES